MPRRNPSADESSGEALMQECYEALRHLAGHFFRRENAGHTLQPTALVNEAYLKLMRDPSSHFEDRAHFMRVAAQSMKRLLIDHARIASAEKRGGRGKPDRLPTMCPLACDPGSETVDVLALHQSLEKLRALNPRHAEMVELRAFAGLTVQETADVLGVSTTTIDKDWRLARAFLRRELARNS